MTAHNWRWSRTKMVTPCWNFSMYPMAGRHVANCLDHTYHRECYTNLRGHAMGNDWLSLWMLRITIQMFGFGMWMKAFSGRQHEVQKAALQRKVSSSLR